MLIAVDTIRFCLVPTTIHGMAPCRLSALIGTRMVLPAWYDRDQQLPQHVLVMTLTCAFVCCKVTSGMVASSNTQGTFNTVADALKANAKICGISAGKDMFLATYAGTARVRILAIAVASLSRQHEAG